MLPLLFISAFKVSFYFSIVTHNNKTKLVVRNSFPFFKFIVKSRIFRVKVCTWRIIIRRTTTRLSRCGQQGCQYGGRHGGGGAFGVVAGELGYDDPGVEGTIPNDAVYFVHFIFSFCLF